MLNSASSRAVPRLHVTVSLADIWVTTVVPPSVIEMLEVEAPAPPDGPVRTGAVVSITRALLPVRESLPPVAGSVRVALVPTLSWMVAPLRAREEVAL